MSKGVWALKLRNWAVEHLFADGRWPFTIASALGAVSVVEAGWRSFAWVTRNQPPGLLAASYVWFTFLSLSAGAALYMVLLRTVYVSVRRERRLRQSESRIAHRTAEVVRRRIGGGPTELDRLFDLLKEHLREVFGVPDIKLTLKITVMRDGQRFLKTAHRSGDYLDIRGAAGEECPIATSYVYDLFKNLEPKQQQVLVSDTNSLDVSHTAYKKRAREFGFRSVLAFPLRTPRKSTDNLWETTNLLGFLSVDAPEPSVFNRFFGLPAKPESEDQVLAPRRPLDTFYAVVDSLATLVMLDEREAVDGVLSSVRNTARAAGDEG